MKYSKVTLIFLTLLAKVLSPILGRADNVPQNPKRILTIYLTGNIGDMIFGTPVFRALKEAKEDTELYVIGRKHNAETLGYNPDVHEYIPCPATPFGLWKEIRRINPDYAFLFTPTPLEAVLLYLARVKAIGVFDITNSVRESQSFRKLKYLFIRIPFELGLNYGKQNLKLLEPLGIHATDEAKHLYFSDTAKEEIISFYKEHGVDPENDFVIAMAPGAGTKPKQWPAERFAKLADHLYKKHQKPIFIVGGPGDKEEFEDTKRAIEKDTKIVSCLHHSIDELKAFMSMIDIIVANDSAPIYIGEAFGKATVVIVGPTDENEHPPEGPEHRMVKARGDDAPALGSALSGTYEFSEEKAQEQIKKVTVEDVIETVDELVRYIQERGA